MSSAIEDFLSPEDEQDIIKAIGQAENNTSGEIRVHLENCCLSNVEDRALEVFSTLNMHKTKLQNAVLIYVAVQEHSFAIYGDKGINAIVADNFWESTKGIIEHHFKKSQFKEGLVQGIINIGQELKCHFPWKDNDQNEITDTISKS